MAKRKAWMNSTDVRDYPDNMSLYEKESLVAAMQMRQSKRVLTS